MKKILSTLLLFLFGLSAFSQSSVSLQEMASEMYYDQQNRVNFIKLKESQTIKESNVQAFLESILSKDGSIRLRLVKSELDDLGFTHKRYAIYFNAWPLVNHAVVAHIKNQKLESVNGNLYSINLKSVSFSMSEQAALANALSKIKAKKYKWENQEEQAHMRELLNQPNFTYYPKGNKVIIEEKAAWKAAYQFEIYAEEPLYKANVFVDANSGQVIAEHNLICNIDIGATANTKYSGTQTITCDQQSTSLYRLRETQRGLGVETYNMNHGTSYIALDFTNTSTSWTTTGADQAATDAHWGAEKTYDYYMARFNRNSIDNMGYKLRSYVHYSNNYNNAFWDGTRMTYGDGNGSVFTILTAIDVCGHEITHGLVSNTSGLNGGGSGEPDALNEAFADIFGSSVERYARPTNFNWKMGSDITPSGNGIRNMQNPKLLSDPDTYGGQYWDAAGEPHNNAGPAIKWFYLLVSGGAATNDLNNAYNVSGIGNIDAEKIAYRALTYYFTSNTNYAAARVAAIQAAKDLFGPCSNQVVQTANAWYAVGVGAQFVPSQIAPNFITSNTSYCTLPASMIFTNTTANGLTYVWDFGDGSSVSTATNAFHTYTSNGMYTVKLKATGCNNMLDSIVKTNYVNINVPSYPSVSSTSICENASTVLTASANATIKWFTSSTPVNPIYVGSTFTTPALNLTTIYYVANTITNSPVVGGRISNTNGGYITNPNQWLTFDVVQSGVLNSVVMYAQSAGNRYIELRNSTANIVNSTVVNLSAGANTVVLNFPLAVGNNYQLGLTSGSTSDLYRSNSANNYPYSIGNCVNITGSSAGTGFYYWFYNWTVTKDDCFSQLAPVYVNVMASIPSTLTVPSIYVCKDDAPIVPNANPTGGTFSGMGVTQGAFNPTVGTGVYYIKYEVNDANGCLRADSLEMQVLECLGIRSNSNSHPISVYPNPAAQHITISQSDLNANKLIICDLQGRVLITESIEQATQQISIHQLAKGLYILTCIDKQGNLKHSCKLTIE